MGSNLAAVRARRAASIWTKIHPIFAIGQLLAFLVSVVLLVLFFCGIVPFSIVHISVLVKVGLMVGAVITGALWEKDVYGQYWFAEDFFQEDVMTLNVFVLQSGYLLLYAVQPANLPALVATLTVSYLVYLFNVAQYVIRTHQISERTPQSMGEAA